jgi:membrane protease YdiL (CAAX protease family)
MIRVVAVRPQKPVLRLITALVAIFVGWGLHKLLIRALDVLLSQQMPLVIVALLKDASFAIAIAACVASLGLRSSDLGFRSPQPSPSWFGLVVSLVILNWTIFVAGIYWGIFGGGRLVEDPFLVSLFEVVILGSVVEEVLFRGCLQKILGELLQSGRVVILTSAAVFALLHSYKPTSLETFASLLAVVLNAFVVGLIAARARWVSGSIYPAIFVHATYNCATLLLVKAILIFGKPMDG